MVREDGIGMKSQLKDGTAGTVAKIVGGLPSAFSMDDYVPRILKMDRAELRVPRMYDDIDFSHFYTLSSLHWQQ
jgi:hypothetical protein